MPASSFLQDVGRVALLVSVVFALLRLQQARARVYWLATNVANMEAFCCAANRLVHSWPPPTSIAIDVSLIVAEVDDDIVAQLDRACRRWRRAGISVRIEGCDRRLSAALMRRGLEAELEVSERTSDIECAS